MFGLSLQMIIDIYNFYYPYILIYHSYIKYHSSLHVTNQTVPDKIVLKVPWEWI